MCIACLEFSFKSMAPFFLSAGTEAAAAAGDEADGQQEKPEGEVDGEGKESTPAPETETQQEGGEETEGGEQAPPQEEGEQEKPASPLPQSDTFAEGERPETPVVAVTEPLSREGSPTGEPEKLEAGTPERMGKYCKIKFNIACMCS